MSTKTSLIPTTTESAKSAERYTRLVALTRKITGLQFIPDGYSPWEGLVCTWRFFYSQLQCDDLLFATLHHLKWGVYPESEDEPMRWAFNKGTPLEQDTAELMALFREELLCPEAEGAAELHAWDGFKSVYHYIAYNHDCYNDHSPKSYSHIHHRYLESRLDHLVHSFDPMDDRWDWYKYFEEAIHFLLPSSAMWTEANWLDEGFILQELDRAFCTNFHANPHSLDPLVHLVFAVQDGYVAPGYCLVRQSALPYGLAKLLWPVDTTNHIAKAYKAVVRVARENERRAKRRKSKQLEPYEFGYAKVKTTGIHQLSKDLVSNGTISDHALKQLVFDMEVSQ